MQYKITVKAFIKMAQNESFREQVKMKFHASLGT